MSTLVIDDTFYHEIVSIIGYPVLDSSVWEMTDDDIKDLYILPALRSYFFWFPVRSEVQYTLGENDFQIDFPTATATRTVIGVLDTRLNTTRYRTGLVTFNPLINAQNIAISSKYRRMYGTRNDYDMYLTRIFSDWERQSTISMWKAFRVRVDFNQQQVFGYSNITGQLSIVWAWDSVDFGDVARNKINDVKKLAQAQILRGFGILRSQQASDVPSPFNYQTMLDMADKYEEDVMNKWKRYSKPVIIRQ